MGRKRSINKQPNTVISCSVISGAALLNELNTPNDSDPQEDKKFLMSLGIPTSVVDSFLSEGENEDEDGV